MSLVKQLAGETAIYGLSSILSRILHYVLLTVYLTRVFATQTYAVYTDMYFYAALILILLTFRMETAYFRFGSDAEQDASAFSSALASITTAVIIVVATLLVFRNDLARLLTYPDKSHYVIYFAGILSLDALAAVPFARLRLENRALRFATIKILNILVNIFLVFLFLEGFPWFIDHGWYQLEKFYQEDNRLDLVFIANLLASFTVILLLLPELLRVKWHFSSSLLKRMVVYAFPLVIVGMAGVFNQSFAVPLLKYMLPGTQSSNLDTAGLYAAAAKLALLMNLFTQAFNYAAEPFFFKQSSAKDAEHVYADVAQAFAMVASVALAGIMLYLDLLAYILGPDYRESMYIVPILLVAYWFLGLYYNVSIWYKLKDQTHMGAFIAVGGSIITLVIATGLIGSYGDIAMAIASLVCYVFMCVAAYILGKKYYAIPYPMARIFTYLLLAILCSAISYGWVRPLDNFLTKLVLNTLILVIYLWLLYLLDHKKILAWAGLDHK